VRIQTRRQIQLGIAGKERLCVVRRVAHAPGHDGPEKNLDPPLEQPHMGPPYAIAAHHVALCLAWSSHIQVVLKEKTQQLKAVSLHVSLQLAMGHVHGVRRREAVDELLKVALAIGKGLLGGGRLCLYLHWGPPGYLWSLTIHRCLVVPPFVYEAVQFGRDSLLQARSAPKSVGR
jgi:hypothetical protein